MCVEAFLAVNFAADFVLLAFVSRSLGLFNLRRVLAAGSLCVVYGLVATLSPIPWSILPIQLLLLTIVSMILVGRAGFRLWRLTALSLFSCALMCGGIGRFVFVNGPIAGGFAIPAGVLVLALLYALRPPGSCRWQIRLRLSSEGQSRRFHALIDTGNRLREPVSGLPVLIVESALLRGLLPEEGYRELRYGVVGGCGIMPCFKPTALWIERGNRQLRAPELWIAVSSSPLPGQFQALAPCDFVYYA